MPRLITHILLPDKFPEGTELAILDHWSRNSYDESIYYLHGESLMLSKEEMRNLVARGKCVALPEAIPIQLGKALMCNSHGEVIFANKKGPLGESDEDWKFIMRLIHAV